MIQIEFSEPDIRQLRDSSINHPHASVRLRALALLLKSAGMPHHQIESTLGVCGNTIRTYLKSFTEGGFEKLTETHFQGPTSKLAPFEDKIRKYLTETPPSSIKQARAGIKKATGVSLSKEQIRRYIKSLGVSYRKVGGVPAKANIATQEKFKTQELEPRLQEAKDGKREVFFWMQPILY